MSCPKWYVICKKRTRLQRLNHNRKEYAISHLLFLYGLHLEGFPGGASGNESAYKAGDRGWIHGSGRRKWQPTPVFMPEKLHGQRSLVGYSPWGHKDLDTTEQAQTRYSIAYMYPVFFIHSSVDGHSGCFHVLAIVNNAAVNTETYESL